MRHRSALDAPLILRGMSTSAGQKSPKGSLTIIVDRRRVMLARMAALRRGVSVSACVRAALDALIASEESATLRRRGERAGG